MFEDNYDMILEEANETKKREKRKRGILWPSLSLCLFIIILVLLVFIFLQNKDCSKTKEKILFESQYDQRFPAKNIFGNEKDVKGVNYWLSPHEKEGTEAFFILDLGCTKIVRGFRIKNTHNAFHHDRGTERFLIFGAGGGGEEDDQEEVEWVQLVNDGLEDPRHKLHIPVKVFHLEEPKNVRFIRFIVVSYFGSGGGLQYFGYF